MLRCVTLLVLARAYGLLKPLGEPNLDTERPQPVRETLENYHDMQYYGKLTVGGQSFHTVLDTGSLEFVVISDKCTRWCGELGPLYHATKSRTYKAGELSVILSYGSGTVLAKEAYENISVGQYNAMMAPFWEVTDADMPLLFDSFFHAIVGLGPIPRHAMLMQRGAKTNAKSFALLLRSMHIDRFSICLGREAEMPGYFTWNDDAIEMLPQAFTRLRTTGGEYWAVKLSDVRLGNTEVGCIHTDCTAIMDSGTSLLALPHSSLEVMLATIDHLGVDCGNLLGLPDIHFKLDGVDFSLPPDSYIGRVHGEATKTMLNHFTMRNTTCQPTLMHNGMKDGKANALWIFGMPFFRRYYSVFVQGTESREQRIYTAMANDHCQPLRSDRQSLLQPRRRERRVARRINISSALAPRWVHSASLSGPPSEKAFRRKRRVFAGQPPSLHPSESTV